MASSTYLILTPPGAHAEDEQARFIRDRFAWLAFLFPAFWLAWHRLWLWAAVALAAQIAAASLQNVPALAAAGLALHIAVSVITALEGPLAAARKLEAAGWTLRDVVIADDLAMAEDIYFKDEERQAEQPVQPLPPSFGRGIPATRPAFGLIGYDGGR